MIPELRQQFNKRYTPEGYARFEALLTKRCGGRVAFRNCETPCFLPRDLLEKMARYGRELILQLVTDLNYLQRAALKIPSEFAVPHREDRPLFIQADFGIDEAGEPKLVEIQGFPSLYAYQPTLASCYREAYRLDEFAPSLDGFLGGFTEARYQQSFTDLLLNGHDPETVILLEVQPETQKTLPDFRLTEAMTGVRTVCVTEIVPQGDRLFYRRKGKLLPIERIYNRTIVDELQRRQIEPSFDFRREYRVEWAGHPDWYYLISKFSLPFFNHVCVPETRFLSEIETFPPDLENYVLKPLFSFAGQGVTVGPSAEQVKAVLDPDNWVLQRKVNFVPTIETPVGKTKVEIRMMYFWEKDENSLEGLQAATVLIRMGRGAMMGVDQNRVQSWVGASAGFIA